MQRLRKLPLLLVTFTLFWQLQAYAEDAYLYIVHGVPGRDVSTSAEPTFPVDILVNDEVCYLHGFSFGSMNGPLSLSPGTYDVKISPANALAPCTNTPLTDSTLSLGSGEDSTAVLAVNESSIPALEMYSNRFQTVTSGYARLVINYAGESSAIGIVAKSTTSGKTYSGTLSPGGTLDFSVPAGNYAISANVGTVTLASETAFLPSQSVELVFAVGETGNQSLSFVNRNVRDVF